MAEKKFVRIAPDQQAFTVRQAAQLLGVADSTLYRMAKQGQIESFRLSARILIGRPTLEKLLGAPLRIGVDGPSYSHRVSTERRNPNAPDH